MRKWIYENKSDVRNTPSKVDGIPHETEDRYRKEGVRFILDVGHALKLTTNPTLGTAAVYFHRFYMFHSFAEFPRHLTALACLFLAGKVEETPKKCRDLVAVAREKMSDAHFKKLGNDPREEVMSVERVLLQTLKFDLQVELPYKFLIRYAKALEIEHAVAKTLVEMGWTFVNDNLSTTLCLLWEPEIIAIAMLHLASKLSKNEIKNYKGFDRTKSARDQSWWDQFVENFDKDIIEDICHQVLDLYSKPKTSSKVEKTPNSSNSSASNTPRPPSTPGSKPPATTIAPTTSVQQQQQQQQPTIQQPPLPPPNYGGQYQPPPPPPPNVANVNNAPIVNSAYYMPNNNNQPYAQQYNHQYAHNHNQQQYTQNRGSNNNNNNSHYRK